jgi:hypothetical protein
MVPKNTIYAYSGLFIWLIVFRRVCSLRVLNNLCNLIFIIRKCLFKTLRNVMLNSVLLT